MNDNIGREGTGEYAGMVWNGKAWVSPDQAPAPQPTGPKQANPKVVIGLLLGIAACVIVSCNAITSQPSRPAPPCPESTATALGGAFEEGFEKGLSGCE